MTVSIIGTIDTENKRINLAPHAITRPAQPNDIVLADGEFHRLTWNHNGQRLTSCNITDLVMAAWHKAEAVQ